MEEKTTFKADKPQLCPYCLEYTDLFSLCCACGLIVCDKRCSISLMHGAVCCDCASKKNDDLDRFTVRERSRASGGMIA